MIIYIWCCMIFLCVVSSNNIEENENTSSDEMESDQPTSTASRSQTDDDIVEIDGMWRKKTI